VREMETKRMTDAFWTAAENFLEELKAECLSVLHGDQRYKISVSACAHDIQIMVWREHKKPILVRLKPDDARAMAEKMLALLEPPTCGTE